MSLGRLVRAVEHHVRSEAAASDRVLLGRFLAIRDEAAFAALVDRHGPAVRGVCRRMLRHPQDEDDAAQAVFVVLARNAATVRKRASLASWLHGVALRVCRKALARRARQAARPRPPTPTATDPADEATWRDVRRVIDEALADVPDHLREPLILCYLNGLTQDEAAAQLGWPLTTFRGRLERGRERLKAALSRRGLAFSAGLLTVGLTEGGTAPAGWAADVARRSLDPSAVPSTVESLTTGVAIVGVRKLAWVPAVLLALGLPAGGVYWAMAAAPANSLQPKKLLAPDPAAGPARGDLKGTWSAIVPFPAGDGKRVYTLTFVDGKHLVWRFDQEGPGMHSWVTIRATYAVEDGELSFTPVEKYVGEERRALTAVDKEPRVYRIAWAKVKTPPRGDLTQVLDLTSTENPDSPFGRLRFAPVDAGQVLPEVLRNVPRVPPKEEPDYRTKKPKYLELAFGPKAGFRVWVVLDGNRLFVDRNGNGDLTDDGDPAISPLPEGSRGHLFIVGKLTDGIRKVEHADMVVQTLTTGDTGVTAAAVRLKVNGQFVQKAGLTDLLLADDPVSARLVHFDSPVLVVRPSPNPGALDANRPTEFRVRVGSPGVWAGSFASRSADDLPKDKNPVAEFAFPTADPKGEPAKLTVKLDSRQMTELGTLDEFAGTVTIPDGVGPGPAKVTLSFPDSPFGKVEPRTYEVYFWPKAPAKK